MDVLTFVIELIDRLIWPLILFILVLLVRRPLNELIPYLKRAKLSELELEFDRDLTQVALDAKEEFEEVTADWRISLTELAESIPSAAVIEAWKEIETRAKALIHSADPDIVFHRETRFKDMQEVMREKELIDTGKVKIFNDLRLIRNKVLHAKDFVLTTGQALQYIKIAIPLVGHMESRIRAYD